MLNVSNINMLLSSNSKILTNNITLYESPTASIAQADGLLDEALCDFNGYVVSVNENIVESYFTTRVINESIIGPLIDKIKQFFKRIKNIIVSVVDKIKHFFANKTSRDSKYTKDRKAEKKDDKSNETPPDAVDNLPTTTKQLPAPAERKQLPSPSSYVPVAPGRRGKKSELNYKPRPTADDDDETYYTYHEFKDNIMQNILNSLGNMRTLSDKPIQIILNKKKNADNHIKKGDFFEYVKNNEDDYDNASNSDDQTYITIVNSIVNNVSVADIDEIDSDFKAALLDEILGKEAMYVNKHMHERIAKVVDLYMRTTGDKLVTPYMNMINSLDNSEKALEHMLQDQTLYSGLDDNIRPTYEAYLMNNIKYTQTKIQKHVKICNVLVSTFMSAAARINGEYYDVIKKYDKINNTTWGRS